MNKAKSRRKSKCDKNQKYEKQFKRTVKRTGKWRGTKVGPQFQKKG